MDYTAGAFAVSVLACIGFATVWLAIIWGALMLWEHFNAWRINDAPEYKDDSFWGIEGAYRDPIKRD
jgi:hypothetical protein